MGMVTAKTSERLGDTYGLAIPATELRKFMAKHLKEFKPATSSGSSQRLEWAQVDGIVSPSVMMILKVGSR